MKVAFVGSKKNREGLGMFQDYFRGKGIEVVELDSIEHAQLQSPDAVVVYAHWDETYVSPIESWENHPPVFWITLESLQDKAPKGPKVEVVTVPIKSDMLLFRVQCSV